MYHHSSSWQGAAAEHKLDEAKRKLSGSFLACFTVSSQLLGLLSAIEHCFSSRCKEPLQTEDVYVVVSWGPE